MVAPVRVNHRVVLATNNIAKLAELRRIVASAAPVTMFVEPGPTDAVQASVERRLRMRA